MARGLGDRCCGGKEIPEFFPGKSHYYRESLIRSLRVLLQERPAFSATPSLECKRRAGEGGLRMARRGAFRRRLFVERILRVQAINPQGANGDQKSLGATSESEEKLVEFSLGTVSTEKLPPLKALPSKSRPSHR